MIISHFENFSASPEDVSIDAVIQEVKGGKYKQLIVQLREYEKGNPEYDRIKKNLPHFTASGSFLNGRKQEDLYDYSGIIVLDIDDIADPEALKGHISKEGYVHFAFISPGGKGLKVGVRVSTGKDYHETAFKQLVGYMEEEYEVKVDRSGKDLSRACFYSYDPDLHYDPDAEVFNEDTSMAQMAVTDAGAMSDDTAVPLESIFGRIDEEAKSKQPEEGRNNHCHQFACICNRKGLDRANAIEYFVQQHQEADFPQTEIEQTIKGAYTRNESEYGTEIEPAFNLLDPSKSFRQKWQKRQPSLGSGPDFEKEVYKNLPAVLKDIEEISPHKNLNGMVLFSSLSILSAVFPQCKVNIGGKDYYANFYALVLAPPASGKGIISDVKDIVIKVDRKMYNQKYNTQLGLDTDTQRSLLIAGDTSKAGMIEQMAACNNPNLMIDTEIDSTSSSNNQDWGNFSDKLRQAYEHETITSKRKKKDQIRIEDPALTMLLAGTPGQLRRFNDDIENGLASRLTPYSFRNDVYIRESERKEIDVDKIIKKASSDVEALFEHNLKHPFELVFTVDQLRQIDDYFSEKHEEYQFKDALKSAILRMKVVLARLCLVLSAIERHGNKNTDQTYKCSEKTFATAMSMIKTLWQHNLCVMEYQGLKTLNFNSRNEEMVYENLADCFTSKELYTAGKKICKGEYSERTIRSWRKGWEKKGYVDRQSHGSYCKTQDESI